MRSIGSLFSMDLHACRVRSLASCSSALGLLAKCTDAIRASSPHAVVRPVPLDEVRWTERLLGRSLRDVSRRVRFPRCGRS